MFCVYHFEVSAQDNTNHICNHNDKLMAQKLSVKSYFCWGADSDVQIFTQEKIWTLARKKNVFHKRKLTMAEAKISYF